ncbi:hypothetical protein [Nocardioides dilutus]
MTRPVETLVIEGRFRGPARSGNGGYTAGALAELAGGLTGHAWPATSVRLRLPPPLDVPMDVERDGEVIAAAYDDEVVAQASAGSDPVAVAPVTLEVARAAEATYPGLATHPFPTCFTCGPGRQPGDGLRIFPGLVAGLDGRPRVAASWTPHQSVADEGGPQARLPVVWAALDCAGAWAADVGERPMVLGSMTARVDALPLVGEPHVVVGHDRGREGRKNYTATSVYDSSGRLVAAAEQVWITVDPSAFN